MLGGDGLSYMRLIHRLAQDPRRYLETMPVVVPRIGENPHGLFHFMHGDWRIWAPLLMRLAAVVNNRQVKADPTIKKKMIIVDPVLSNRVSPIGQILSGGGRQPTRRIPEGCLSTPWRMYNRARRTPPSPPLKVAGA